MLLTTQTTLDWDVLRSPLTYNTPEGDRKTENRVALYRDDTYDMLGIVSNDYEIFQNWSLKNLVTPMVEEGLLEIVNMGEIANGRRVFIQAQMAKDFWVAGEETKANLTFLNSHDGSTALCAGVTSVRVICQNTFAQAATDMDSRLRHAIGINDKAVTIQETTRYVNEGMRKYQEAAESLSRHRAVGSEVDDIIARAFGKKTAAEVRVRDQIQNLFRNGKGNCGETLWDAVNAITEYSTHKSRKTADGRYQYANFGQGARVSRRAMDAALALV